ncbi:Uncharacterized conserved protein YfdQ, DUF2303 family [Georgenia satyanarayanai]|uniref:Uncharacterized conserved protein YfdQ, DUF2303 family n=1 Tax=Georgenia satyanarayanai TaxID=860221 RepID=A0A2Y9A7T4_9MICO|nr:DUF2303 family protein [Georgenia satyanarayanai]PYG00185.1 uncharacterized protein YfdQ (DUF2303 family) [Georgenia satyanarayanai]SSA40420.1 Uncharacterized conserved protein YfdQ, DUF2303 family [Georgenia satyanarayanai]
MTTTTDNRDRALGSTDERVEGDVVAELAQAATTPQPIGEPDENRFYAITTPLGGTTNVVDLDELREPLNPYPSRKRGIVTVRDADSFNAYLDRHSTVHTEVWADRERGQIVGVINGHAPKADGNPGHGDHRVTLALRKTPSWQAWEQLNGKMLGQAQFAEHIEDRQIDIVDPKPADMLEVVQTFKAAKKVDFESSQRLSSGEVVLEYRETVNAQAGKKGQLTIPERFTLGLQPYDGSAGYKVTARLRYRINDGHLLLGYALDRPEDVLEEAFNDVVDEVEGGITAPLFRGWPA